MRTLARFVQRQWIARPLAVFSVCFLLGILWASRHGGAAIVYLLSGLILAAVCIVGGARLRNRWVVLPLAAAFLLGGARMELAQDSYPPVAEQFSVQFEGTVVSDPVYHAQKERIICSFRLNEIDGTPENCTVRLYLRSDKVPLEGIEYGQTLRCFGHVWPQDHASNPYQFDSYNWLLSDGMTGMAAAKLEDVKVESAPPSLSKWMIAVRHAISSRIDLLFPQNAELVRALVLGDRSTLDTELREAFSRTGVAHLICISGMHISVLALAISRLLDRFLSRKYSVGITLAAILLYGFLVGYPPALIRATIMFSVFSMSSFAGRSSDTITRLGVALLIMLAVHPFHLYDGGFVLSFEASAGIVLLEPALEHLLGVDRLMHQKPHRNRVRNLIQRTVRYFPALLCATLSAQLATLPTVIAYFGAQPLCSVLVNLLAVPLTMFAYPVALIALCLSAVWMPLGCPAGWIADRCLSLLVEMLRLFAVLPFSQLRSPRFPDWLVVVHWSIVVASSQVNKLSIRIRRFLPLTLAMLIGVSMLGAWIGSLGFQAVFLDAGQADAAVVRTEGRVYLFDVGDLYSPVADYVSGACLGVDAVFLSHPHYDHAAGLAELLKAMPPKVIYVPSGWFDVDAADSVQEGIDLAMDMGIPIVELAPGETIALSEHATARICESNSDTDSVNDLSMLIEVTYRESSLLFTGDLSTEGEPEQIPDVDVLKVPHHGSKKACSESMLQMTTPDIAIVSVGDNNYGHPSEVTLERLADFDAQIYRTDQCGAITVRIAPNGTIQVETYLCVEERK